LNVVGWFNIVSYISYAVIALGAVCDDFSLRNDRFGAAAGFVVYRRHDITVTYKQSVTREQIAAALQKVGVADAQINTLSKPGDVGTPRWTIETKGLRQR